MLSKIERATMSISMPIPNDCKTYSEYKKQGAFSTAKVFKQILGDVPDKILERLSAEQLEELFPEADNSDQEQETKALK